jgi:Flp pilus assembly protein TadG
MAASVSLRTTNRPPSRRLRPQRGQSTVELACLLPVLVLCLLLAVQVGLVVRDRVLLVHGARLAGRAAIVDPSRRAATAALARQGSPVDRATVSLAGDTRPGGLLTVTLRMHPTRVPVVGRVVSSMVLEEQLSVMVEGSA